MTDLIGKPPIPNCRFAGDPGKEKGGRGNRWQHSPAPRDWEHDQVKEGKRENRMTSSLEVGRWAAKI